jgi:hypothetical protein
LANNQNLSNLDNGDLKHEIDFRSVYASLLQTNYNLIQLGLEQASQYTNRKNLEVLFLKKLKNVWRGKPVNNLF